MKKRFILLRLTACCLALTAVCAALPASAEESAPMTFRIGAERHYVLQSELSEGDLLIPGALYIENYTGITEMVMKLISDAPLHIENGDFTRDDTRTEYAGTDPVTKEKLYQPKPCFFTNYAEGRYTQHSDETGEENAVMWCSAGWMAGVPGELYRPESSFLSFDIRVPADTPAGVYTCRLSTEENLNEAGLTVYDFYAYCGEKNVTDSIALEACTITVEPAPLRGDVNCDGIISVEDAQNALSYYTVLLAKKVLTDRQFAELFGTPYIHTAQKAADASLNNEVSVEDAQGILQYYTAVLSRKTPKWSDYF